MSSLESVLRTIITPPIRAINKTKEAISKGMAHCEKSSLASVERSIPRRSAKFVGVYKAAAIIVPNVTNEATSAMGQCLWSDSVRN